MPDIQSRSVLLTGASGYVGGHVATKLRRAGYDVHCLVRSASDAVSAPSHLYDGDIESVRLAMAAARPAAVVHIASAVLTDHRGSDIDMLIDANVRLPTQLLETMVEAGCRRFVNTGSFWQNHAGDDAYDPVNLYAATKQAASDILTYYAAAHDVAAIELVLFDVYGPHDPRRKLLPILFDLLRSGGALGMTPGDQELCLVHVQDVASAFLHAVEMSAVGMAGQYHRYAVRGEEIITPKLLVETIERIAGRRLDIEWGGRPYRAREVMRVWRGPILPHWQTQIPLAEGMAELLEIEALQNDR